MRRCFSVITQSLMFSFCLFSSCIKSETFLFASSESSPPFSYLENETASGLIPDLIRLVFSLLPDDQAEFGLYPWARAQLNVENGLADGLMTYPSQNRQRYMEFTESPVNILDYGYLIFHKDNPKRLQIQNAKSFDDLATLTILTQTGAGWEQDNIPETINKIEKNNLETMIHVLLYRREGDFIIMPIEQAMHYTRQFGYQNFLAYQHVTFINDAVIPFHIGIRKSHPQAKRLLHDIEKILTSQEFKTGKQLIQERYLRLPE